MVRLVDGWQVSGTVFLRSGLPFTLTDGGTSSALESSNYGTANAAAEVFGTQLTNSGVYVNCGVPNQNICLNSSAFTTSPTNFGNVQRNSLRGPDYFSSDFTLMKFTSLLGWEKARVGVGAQFFNVFNHPNFQQPVGDASSPNFGQILATVSPATSIFGSGLGADSSPRLIQLKAEFEF